MSDLMFTFEQVSSYMNKTGLSQHYDAIEVYLNMDSWRRLGPNQMGKPCGRGWVGLRGACQRAKHHGGDKAATLKASKLALADKIRGKRGLKSRESVNEGRKVPVEKVKKARKARTPKSVEKVKKPVEPVKSMEPPTKRSALEQKQYLSRFTDKMLQDEFNRMTAEASLDRTPHPDLSAEKIEEKRLRSKKISSVGLVGKIELVQSARTPGYPYLFKFTEDGAPSPDTINPYTKEGVRIQMGRLADRGVQPHQNAKLHEEALKMIKQHQKDGQNGGKS